jgi:hypothetical protein
VNGKSTKSSKRKTHLHVTNLTLENPNPSSGSDI